MQTEFNYLDWNYTDEINSRNIDAVYLYGELVKRGITAVIIEPLLGGRLINLPAENIVFGLQKLCFCSMKTMFLQVQNYAFAMRYKKFCSSTHKKKATRGVISLRRF